MTGTVTIGSNESRRIISVILTFLILISVFTTVAPDIVSAAHSGTEPTPGPWPGETGGPDRWVPLVGSDGWTFRSGVSGYNQGWLDMSSGDPSAVGSFPTSFVAADNDNVYFRMRVLDSPFDNAKNKWQNQGYYQVEVATNTSGTWESAFLVGVDVQSSGELFIYDATNDTQSTIYAGTSSPGPHLDLQQATDGTDGGWWVSFQVPVDELTTHVTDLELDTEIRLFYGTSIQSNSINRDTMDGTGTVNFDDVITVTTEDVEGPIVDAQVVRLVGPDDGATLFTEHPTIAGTTSQAGTDVEVYIDDTLEANVTSASTPDSDGRYEWEHTVSTAMAAGNYTTRAQVESGGNLSISTTRTFTIEASSAAGLAFPDEPADTLVDTTLDPVTVQLVDGDGGAVSEPNHWINLTLLDSDLNPATSATLNGTTGRFTNQTGGVMFDDLSVDQPGEYHLRADATDIQHDDSIAFSITSDTQVNPAYQSSEVTDANPDQLRITFDGNVTATDASGLTLNSPADLDINGFNSTSGGTVILELNRSVFSNESLTASYDNSTGTIQSDEDGSDAQNFTSEAVTNNVSPIGPAYQSSKVTAANDDQLRVTFDANVSASDASGFTLNAPTDLDITALNATSGDTVVLQLNRSVLSNESLTASYDNSTGTVVSTDDGSNAQHFSSESVTNNADSVQPQYVSAEVTAASDDQLRVTFDANVDATNASGFTLDNPADVRTDSLVGVEQGDTVVLQLNRSVFSNESLTLSYNTSAGTVVSADDGSDAQSFSAEGVTNNVDDIAPAYVSSNVADPNDDQLRVTFDANVSASDASGFSFDSPTDLDITGLDSTSSDTVVLQLNRSVLSNENLTLSYDDASGTVVSTKDGSAAKNFTSESVTISVDTIAPVYVSSEVTEANDDQLRVAFDVDISATNASGFALNVSDLAISGFDSTSGDTIVLQLNRSVFSNESFTVSFDNSTGSVESVADGSAAQNFTEEDVTNSVDPIAPAYVSSEVTNANDDQLRVTFDANVRAEDATGFTLDTPVDAGIDSLVEVSGDTVVLQLSRSVFSNESLTASYDGTGTVVSAADGSDAQGFSEESVTNNVDEIAPTYISAEVTNASNDRLRVTFDTDVEATNASGFSLDSPTGLDITALDATSGDTVVLQLNRSVLSNESLSVSYVNSTGTVVSAADGSDAQSFSGETVAISVDPIAPAYVSSEITSTNDEQLRVTFDADVDATDASGFSIAGAPDLQIESLVGVDANDTVVLRLNRSVLSNESLTLSYDNATGSVVSAADGSDAQDFSTESVTTTVAPISPAYASSEVTNATDDRLRVTFDANVSATNTTGFSLNVSDLDITGLDSTSGDTVVLQLNRSVFSNESLGLSYDNSTGSVVSVDDGSAAQNFSNEDVTISVESIEPAYVSSEVTNANAEQLRVTYDVDVTAENASGFTLNAPGDIQLDSLVAVSSDTIVLTLNRSVLSNESLSLSYEHTSGTVRSALDDSSAQSFSEEPVTNNVDPIQPQYVSSEVTNATDDQLRVSFDANVSATDASGFNLASPTDLAITGLDATSGDTVVLQLNRSVFSNESVSLSYDHSTGTVVSPEDGSSAQNFNSESVTNNVGPIEPQYVSSDVTNATDDQLRVTFDGNVTAVDATGFTLDSPANLAITGLASTTGDTVIIQLNRSVLSNESLALSYDNSTGSVVSADDGSDARSFSGESVTNNLGQITPTYASSKVPGANDDQLRVIFDANVDATNASGFSLNVSDLAITGLNVTSDDTVVLQLNRSVLSNESLALSYDNATGTVVSAEDGSDAQSFSNEDVTISVDPIQPQYVSSEVTGATDDQLRGIFDANVDATSASGFSLNVSDLAITGLDSISSDTVVLQFNRSVLSNEIVSLDYDNTTGTVVSSEDGSAAQNFSGEIITNNVAAIAPAYASSEVTDTPDDQLRVTFDANVTATDASGFSLESPADLDISGFDSVSNDTVVLQLNRLVLSNESASLSYDNATGTVLSAEDGSKALSFNGNAVANDVVEIAPEYVSSEVTEANDDQLRVTFDANVDATNASGFTLDAPGDLGLSGFDSVSNDTVVLQLNRSVLSNESINLRYTNVTGSIVSSLDGSDAKSFSDEAATNNVDSIAPAYVSAEVANDTDDQLRVTFDANVSASNANGFSIDAPADVEITGLDSTTGGTVIVQLNRSVLSNESLSVSYANATGTVRSAADGSDAQSFSGEGVTNNVAEIAPVYVSSEITDGNDDRLQISFDVDVAATNASGFTLDDPADVAITGLDSTAGERVILQLNRSVSSNESPTVSYDNSTANVVSVEDGSVAGSFSGEAVSVTVDAIAPTYVSAEVTNATDDQLQVTFDANVSATNASGFQIDSPSDLGITGLNSTEDATVVLDLDRSITSNETVVVSYDGAGTVVSATDGSAAQNFSTETVTNNVDPVAPAYVSSEVTDANDDQLRVTFDADVAAENVSGVSIDSPADLTIDGLNETASSGETLVFDLNRSVLSRDTIAISYSSNVGTIVSADDGSDADGFSGESVTNNALDSATFEVEITNVNSPVTEGETGTVSVNVTNTGDDSGTQTIRLTDTEFSDQERDAIEVTLDGGTFNDSIVLEWVTGSGDAGTGNITVQTDDDAASTPVTIDPAPADSIAMTVHPGTTRVDAPIDGPPSVNVTDRFGSAVSGASVTVSVNASAFSSGTTTVSTNDTGVATFDDLVMTTAGAYVLTAELADNTSVNVTSDTFDVVAGSANATESAVIATPTEGIVADGSDRSTVTVTVQDTHENPITDLGTGNFTIDVEGASNSTVTSANDGNYTFELTHTVAESVNVTVTVDETELTDRPIVTFVTGSVNATTSSVTAEPTTDIVADGSDASTVTIAVRDGEGNAIDDLGAGNFTISAEGAQNTTVAHAGAGNYTFDLTHTVTDSVNVTVTTDAIELDDQPTITFVSGGVSASESGVVADPSDGVVADGEDSSTITVTVRDGEGNSIDDLTSGNFSVDADGGSTTTTTATGDGNYTFDLTHTVAESVNVAVTVDDIELTEQPTVTFVAGSVNRSTSSVSADPTTDIVANGSDTSTITVTVRDAEGNPITELGPGNFSMDTAGAANTTVTPIGDGNYSLDLTHNVAESVTVTATVDGVTIDERPSVTFVSGPVNASRSSVAANPTAGVIADGEDGASVTVTVRDGEGNRVDDLSVGSFSIDAENASNTTVTAVGDGNYTFDLTHTVAESVNVTVTVDEIQLDDQPMVTFASGPVNASTSSVSADPTEGIVADGSDSSTVTVTALDTHENPITGLESANFSIDAGESSNTSVTPVGDGKYTFDLTHTVAELVNVTVTIDGRDLDEKPSVTYVSGSANGSISNVTADPTTGLVADGADASTITVSIRDGEGSSIDDLSAGNFSISSEGAENTTITAMGDGNYTFDLTHTVAESVNVTVTVDETTLDEHPTISFVAGSVNASTSSVSADPTTGIVADGNESSTVTITVRDGERNGITDLDPGNFTIDPDGASHSSVTHAGDGNYTFDLTHTVAESVSLTVTVDGIEVVDHPSVTFTPGPVNGSTSNVSADPSAGVIANGTDPSTLTITVLDAEENPISGLKDSDFTITSGGENVTIDAVNGRGDGNYTTTVTSTNAETAQFEVEVDGTPIADNASIAFVAGAISVGQSSVSATPTAGIVANGTDASMLTIVVQDAQGNAITGLLDENITISTDAAVSDAVNETDDGVYVANITHTVAENVTVLITIDSVDLTDSAELAFSAADADSVTVETQPINATAGDSIGGYPSATVTDAFDNPVAGVAVTVVEVGGYTFDNGTTTATTNPSGIARFDDLVIETAETAYQIEFSIDDADSDVATADSVLSTTFDVAASAPDSVAVSVATDEATANNTDELVFDATIEDAFGNPVSGVTVDAADTGTAVTYTSGDSLTTDADGRVTFTATSTDAQTIAFTATEQANDNDGTVTASFTALSPAYESSTVTDAEDDRIRITFDGNVSVSDVTGFSLNGPADLQIESLAGVEEGDTIIVQLNRSVRSNEQLTVSYDPDHGTVVSSEDGTDAEPFSAEVVDNTVDSIEPTYDSTAVSHPANEFVITFDSDVTVDDALQAQDDVTVAVDGIEVGVTAVADGGSDDSIVVTIDQNVSASDEIDLSFDAGESSVVSPTDDSPAQAFSVSSANPSFANDVAAFTIVSMDPAAGVSEGEDLNVAVTVENTGGAEGSQTVELVVDTEQNGSFNVTADSAALTLLDGERETLSLTYRTTGDDTPAVDVRVTTDDHSAITTATIDVALASLSLTLADTEIPAGTETSVAVQAAFTNGSTIDVSDGASLSSSNSSVATVASNGTVTAAAEGTVVLEAAYEGEAASGQLTVSRPRVVEGGLTITLSTDELEAGAETTATVDATFSNGTVRDVTEHATIRVLNESVATLSSSGLITAVERGSTAVDASFEGEDARAELVVHRSTPDIADVGVDPQRLNFGNVTLGETVRMNVTVTNRVRSTTDLTVSSTMIVGHHPDDFAVAAGGAPFVLEPGDSREIEIEFTPLSAGIKQAQLRIISDANNEPQIDIWLSNTGTYIAVQERAADSDQSNDTTVNVEAINVDRDTDVIVNVSRPSTRASHVGFEELATTVKQEGDFEMDLVHSPEPISGGTVFSSGERTPRMYVTILHGDDVAPPDVLFDNTSIRYRVSKDAVPTGDPADVALYRFDGQTWVEMDSVLIGESRTDYRFEAETPGFSQFVVTAPDAPETPAGDTCRLFGLDFGAFIVCWYWWIPLIPLTIVGLGGYVVLRRGDEDE